MIIYTASDFEQFEKHYRIHFFNSLTGYKSVHLVGTQNAEGTTNLAIFSSIFHMGSKPPYFGMLVRPTGETPRHTLANLLETGYYTLNHIHPHTYKQAHQTSAKYPKDVSEFDAVGLTPWYSEKVKAPYVFESNIKIGLKLVETHPMSFNGTILVVGNVVEVIFKQPYALPDGMINLEQAQTITSTGLDVYAQAKTIERLERAKPN